MVKRWKLKDQLNRIGLVHFGGWFKPEDIQTVQALSAKTDETVARIKADCIVKKGEGERQ